MVTAQFVAVDGSSAIDLQEIKAVGEDTSDNVVVSILDKYGYTSASYSCEACLRPTFIFMNKPNKKVQK